ncbi:MAG: HlyD family efflux transporter periplasmic adaptor subunit [Opitutales bacterium]|jgi:HlyD family secretion protein
MIAWRKILAGTLAALALAGCGGEKKEYYQGYLEGRFLGVASPQEGQLLSLNVRRGDIVKAGAPLFALDPQPETDDLRQADDQVASAQSKVDDLRKGLRDTELAELDAQLREDRAQLELANLEWKRSEPLKEKEFVSAHEFDRLRLTVDQLTAVTDKDSATLATGKLGSRDDQVRQAAADLTAAEAVRDRAQWLLDQKTQTAPQDGYVQDTLFRVGERVEPGQPVVVLLPATELCARFFVPEPDINQVKIGQQVNVTLDGLAAPIPARVSYISTQVEFTPPVIYSESQNYKYVFMVEADFDPAVARTLHVGQPAEVSLRP